MKFILDNYKSCLLNRAKLLVYVCVSRNIYYKANANIYLLEIHIFIIEKMFGQIYIETS
jgi:hypothetical protein